MFHHHGPVGRLVSQGKVTELYDAAKRADYDAVQCLLDKGADVRARNLTGVGLAVGIFPYHNAIDTLCGLDAMRTSKDQRIVFLAEEKFGPETDEDFIERRDAFDTLYGYYRYNSTTPFKPKIEKAIPAEQKESVAKKRSRSAERNVGALPGKQKRYGVRKRDQKCYRPRKRDPDVLYV